MIVLNVRNVHEALPRALHMLYVHGRQRPSRNGPVRVYPEPVATVYDEPCERVLFHPWRDANPYFHFYESLWMLAGRRDIAPLVRFAKQLAEYSDDGVTQNAAYGYRWRNAEGKESGTLGVDQLAIIAAELRKNKDSRQCVLQIWDHVLDLGTQTKDHACNLSATFQVNTDGRLDMSVFCRSNDAVWGAYGANAVHFSALLEYMAAAIGVPVGQYTQISVNLHAYDATADKLYEYCSKEYQENPYELEPLYPYPMVSTSIDSWDEQVRRFVTTDGRAPADQEFEERFFRHVAVPIVRSHDAWRDGGATRRDDAMKQLVACEADDWRTACQEWLMRRKA